MFYKTFGKKIIDLTLSLLALPVFMLLVVIIGLLIKIDDGGPIFYRAPRLGKNCKILYMYKFRSMKVNSPNILNSDGSTYNAKDDFRVTKIGKFIRETSIDELPQLLNILKGEMSIIGPRASLYSALSSYMDDEMDKMKVLPGITGYTQAYFRNNLSVREKRLKDAWYVNNMSFLLDVKIFFKTIETVIFRKNLYTNNK